MRAHNAVGCPRVFCASVVVANLADLDLVPGVSMGELELFYRQATHSLTAAMILGLEVAILASWWKRNGLGWGLWAGGFYGSHIVLDLLAADATPPFGVQLLWPLSDDHLIAPVNVFAN